MNHLNISLLSDCAASRSMSATLLLVANLETLIEMAKDDLRVSMAIPVEHNLNANNAYRLMQKQHVPLIDVRTVQEYQFVGHVPASYNMPLYRWSNKWDEKIKNFAFEIDPDFTQDFMSIFPEKDEPYIFICRSGHRSKQAVELLVESGYTNLYNMWEGFEGIAVKDKTLPNYGQKTVDGWKNRGLPCTWDIDKSLIKLKTIV